jgi:hypothetical protein
MVSGDSLLTPDFLDRLLDRTTDTMLEDFLAPLSLRMLSADGRAFGEFPLDRDDRIASVIDDHQTGLLEALASDPVTRPEFERVKRQFERDVAETNFPGFTPPNGAPP